MVQQIYSDLSPALNADSRSRRGSQGSDEDKAAKDHGIRCECGMLDLFRGE